MFAQLTFGKITLSSRQNTKQLIERMSISDSNAISSQKI
jgi:hypothetical protein